MKEKNINGYPFQLYKMDSYNAPQLIKRSADFLRFMDKRRSVRDFSTKAVPREVIENIILTASTSPSYAHRQSWTFCAVSDPKLKHAIRLDLEKDVQENNGAQSAADVLSNMWQLQNSGKEYVDNAPWLIIVFKREDEHTGSSESKDADKSVGIATGILLSAVHNAGLAALPYSTSQFQIIKEKLGRPANEQPFLMVVVGYPSDECYVPKLIRKGLKDVAVFYEQ